jgi:hypothetical protein
LTRNFIPKCFAGGGGIVEHKKVNFRRELRDLDAQFQTILTRKLYMQWYGFEIRYSSL